MAGRWALVRRFLCGPQGLGLPHWAVPQSRGPPLEQGTALRVTWLENRPDKWGHCKKKGALLNGWGWGEQQGPHC